MRLFDLAGIFFVALWVVVMGAYLSIGQDDDNQALSLTDGVVELDEGTQWMTVFRAGEEVGVLREDRTRLIDGWLIENMGIVELDFMGDNYAFKFTSRSTLNTDLTLRSAIADVYAFGMHLKMQGQYRGDEEPTGFYLNVLLDDASRQFMVPLDERPRLATQAIPQMLASPDLEEGQRFRQEFFDPLTLAPSDIELLYEGREEINNSYFSEKLSAHVFGQSVGNFRTRIFTDDKGQVVRQVMPMQVAMSRLPDALGQSSLASFTERFDDLYQKRPPFINAIDAEDLLAMVAQFGSGNTDRFRPVDGDDQVLLADDGESSGDDDRPETREFTIEALDDTDDLDLKSPRQHIAFQVSEQARVETNADNRLWHAGDAPQDSTYEARPQAPDQDAIDDLVNALTALDEEQRLNAEELQQLAPEYCQDFAPQWSPDNESLPGCLALFADALATVDRAPHFVFGIRADGNELRPHIWLALYDSGEYGGEVDLLRPSHALSADYLQLYLADTYRPQPLQTMPDQISAH